MVVGDLVVRGVSDASVSQLRLTITPAMVTAAYVRTLTATATDSITRLATTL